MTLDEMELSIKEQIGRHTRVSTRFEYINIRSSLLLEAFSQIKKTVMMIQMGIEDAKDHRAEALLLLMLQDAYHHGYTPKET
jgi:hypothetical protein